MVLDNRKIKKSKIENNKLEHEEVTERDKIFKTLIHFPGSSFTDLWDKSIESNKFTYYLKKLEQEGTVEKREGKYHLTVRGKAKAVTISGATGQTQKKRPFVALLLVPRKDGHYILYKRMKEPYYGVCGFPGAKVEMGEEILEAAKRELFEETGLTGEGKIVGVQNAVIINDGVVFAHMVQYIVLFDEPSGDLIKNNREGTYEWEKKDVVLAQKNLFPDVEEVIKSIEAREFIVKEVQMIQENEKFVDIKSKVLIKIPDFF